MSKKKEQVNLFIATVAIGDRLYSLRNNLAYTIVPFRRTFQLPRCAQHSNEEDVAAKEEEG